MALDDHIGLHVRVGISGAGKTHDVKQSAFRAARDGMAVVVLDRMYEWNEVPRDLAARAVGAATPQAAMDAINKGALIAIVRSAGDPMQVAIAACELVKQRSHPRHGNMPTGIAIPEAHVIAPRSHIADPIREVATAWRHFRCAAWFDTQRIAQINGAITENARDFKIFATIGELDLARFKDIARGSSELADAAMEAAERLERGEPGWHVRLGLRRRPPYELVRD